MSANPEDTHDPDCLCDRCHLERWKEQRRFSESTSERGLAMGEEQTNLLRQILLELQAIPKGTGIGGR